MDWSCFHWLPLECSPAELLRMVCVGFFLYTRTLGQIRGRGLKSSVWPTCQAICPMLESVHPGKGCPFLICTKSPKRQKHYRRLVMLPWGLQSGFLFMPSYPALSSLPFSNSSWFFPQLLFCPPFSHNSNSYFIFSTNSDMLLYNAFHKFAFNFFLRYTYTSWKVKWFYRAAYEK